MKTKPKSIATNTPQNSYQVVGEKLRITNAYIEKIDLNQLRENVEQLRKKQG